MPIETPRPAEDATAALALSGEAADQIADALLEVREARSRLRRVDSLLAALLAEVQRRLEPENTQGPEDAALRAPQHVRSIDNNNATDPDAGSARTRNVGNTCPISGEVLCPL
jgi:hypothetical protein